jgi:quercetin dioxygenase-like cupin family protein
MAISHAQSGQVIDLQPLGTRLHSEKTVALFKAQDLELMRLVLPRGKSMPAHKVAGEITVQCIEGRIDITVEGHSHVLSAGQLLYLSGGVLHGVVALEDASALVTIALRK